MISRRCTLALLLALAAAACADAAYRPGFMAARASIMNEEQSFAQQIVAAARHARDVVTGSNVVKSHKRGDEKAYIAMRYFVDPERHDDFIGAWKDLEDSVKDSKGNCIFSLKKTMDDDVVFVGYAEWKSFRDLEDHAESEEMDKFTDRMEDLDVAWTIQPLYMPKDAEELSREGNRCGGGDVQRRKRDERRAHMLIRYFAPPSAHDDLVDAWSNSLDGTSQEQGSVTYSLRKVLNDNIQWVGYGTWDSIKDLQDHMESDHVRKLHSRLADLRVYWRVTPLIDYEDFEREQH